MRANKISRRRFLEGSTYLSVMPFIFSSILPFTVIGGTGSQTYPTDSNGSDLERLTNFMKQKDPLIWVFTGDSITHGAKHTGEFWSYPEYFLNVSGGI
jgi:acyl-CoA thioesterase I